MTSDNDFDRLKAAMRAATPAPDADRKAEILALAQKNFERHQGSITDTRLNSEPQKERRKIRGLFAMIKPYTIGAITGTTALVALGVVMFSPTGELDLTEQQPATLPEVLSEAAQPTLDQVSRPAPVSSEEAMPHVLASPVPAIGGTSIGRRRGEDFSAGAAGEAYPLIYPPNTSFIHDPEGAPVGEGVEFVPLELDQLDAERFATFEPNPLMVTAEEPVSTFSIDVDTASYAMIRSMLNRGELPPPGAVRVEEMVNYFSYDWPAPEAADDSPFRPTIELFETPWNPGTQLLQVALQGELPATEARPPLNLVLLIDTSGSMQDPSKLPLLVQSFRLMIDRLRPEDEVAIVTYAGSSEVKLQPTAASDRQTILNALESLQAGGGTNGEGGLETAYRLASEMRGEGEISRVMLATDGDFNLGISDPDALADFIEAASEDGTYLSVLGFGRGNLRDDTMQALAQHGNGTAAYIDTLNEAQRALVDQLAGSLFPIADDVKVQIEFNPAVIAEYRLIGYETRALAREDFANDAVDAGELGAGHSVVALYEVTPVGSPATLIAPLRYGDEATPAAATERRDELGFIALRWKEPGSETSDLAEFPISSEATLPSAEAQFAAAIAGFGRLLRGETLGEWDYSDAIDLALPARGEDEFGLRQEAISLMRLAESLSR